MYNCVVKNEKKRSNVSDTRYPTAYFFSHRSINEFVPSILITSSEIFYTTNKGIKTSLHRVSFFDIIISNNSYKKIF